MDPKKVFIRGMKNGKRDSVSIAEVDNERLYEWALEGLGLTREKLFKTALERGSFDVENREKLLNQLSKYFTIYQVG